MVRNLLIVVVLLAAAWVGGCNPVSAGAVGLDSVRELVQGHKSGETLVDTKLERNMRLSLMQDIQSRQALDDWDYIWLIDHAATTNEWHAIPGP